MAYKGEGVVAQPFDHLICSQNSKTDRVSSSLSVMTMNGTLDYVSLFLRSPRLAAKTTTSSSLSHDIPSISRTYGQAAISCQIKFNKKLINKTYGQFLAKYSALLKTSAITYCLLKRSDRSASYFFFFYKFYFPR